MRVPRHVDHDEIDSAGLLEAAGKFDRHRGVKFHTYAGPLIRGRILDALRRSDRAGRRARALHNLRCRAARDLAQRYGRRPTEDELLDELGWDAERIALSRPPHHFSLADPLHDEHQLDDARKPLVIQDALADGRQAARDEPAEIRSRIEAACRGLSRGQRDVVVRYFADGQRLTTIGQELGISESRCSQLLTTSLAWLRAERGRDEILEALQ